MADATIEIGEFRLDTISGVLSRGGDVVPLRAKTFAFLCHLARNRGRVVSKDELFDAVWPNIHVSEDSLTQCVSELRKAFGSGQDSPLRTVPKRGYLLASGAALPTGAEQAFPAVAVLPFANVGPDSADRTLIDGMVEELTYGLARFRSIVVIAPASAFTFRSETRPSVDEIGSRLGAEFVVEGSASRAAGRFRVTVTLLHAASGRRIWGDRFDFPENDLFAMNMEIATTIISRLVSNIDRAILQGAAPSARLAAFENFTRGLVFLRGYGDGVNERARDHFRRAIDIDPDFALAHAYLGLTEVIIADYAACPRPMLEAARQRISLAITLEPEEARCHRMMGIVQLFLREYDASERSLRHSYQINPYDADTLCQLGYVLTMRGRSEEGLAWTEKAIALNPFRPYWYDSDRAYALYALGRYEEAVSVLLSAPAKTPYTEMRLAAAHAMAGDMGRAIAAFRRFREEIPDDDIEALCCGWEFEHARDITHFAEGLRRVEAALALSD